MVDSVRHLLSSGRLLLVTLAVLVAACGGVQTPEGPPFSRLSAATEPQGSEVLLAVGDVDALRDALLASGIVGQLETFLSAEIDLLEGQFERAFERYGLVVQEDPNSLTGILAAERLGGLAPIAGRYAERGAEVLAPLAGRPLNPLASLYVNRFELEVRAAAHQHVGADNIAPFSAEDAGLPDEWRVAGPFGRLPRLDLERAEPFDADLVLAESYTPEGRRVAARRLPAESTAFTLGMATGGTWVLETWAHLDAASNRVASLEVPVGAILEVDGVVVLERRESGPYQPTTLLRPLQLSAGWHRIRLRLGWLGFDDDVRFRLLPLVQGEPGLTFAARPPEGVVMGTAVPGERRAASALEELLPRDVLEPAGAVEAMALLQLAADFRQDELGERALAWFDAQPAVSPIVSVWKARLAGGMQTISPSERHNRRLQWMREALAMAPSADGALLPMLAVLVSDGREEEALRLARGVAERLAHEPAAQIALFDLYQRRGWDELAETALERAAELDPSNCTVVVSLLDLWAYRDHYPALEDMPEGFATCEAALYERLQLEIAGGDVERAEATLHTLQARRPADSAPLRQLFDLAMWRGDWEGAGRVLETADEAALPALDRAALEVDWQLSRGQTDEALATIETALAEESPGDYLLHRMAALLRQEPLMADLRVDTEEAIAAYQARGEMLRAPVIYALDYGAFRYFEDGSGMSITHQILHIRTRDALATYGEVSVPPAAILLRARTIKADGTILEPDNIPGKETISMPNLEVGDFVEYEYLELIGPSRVRGDTLLGPRFYFQVFDAPLTHSELIVEVPAGWSELVVDRWADGPQPEITVEGDFRRYRFVVENSPQPVDEPGTPPLDELLPSVRLAHAYTWNDVRDYYVDQRVAVTRPTAELEARAAELVGDADEPREAMRRIFRWVVDDVRETGGFLSGDAVWTLRQGEGERLPLLLALYEAAGFDADLVFLRSWEEPQIDSAIPDADQYPHTAVRVRDGDGETEVWLDPAVDHAPFDYLQPHIQGAPGLVVSDRRTAEVRWVAAPEWPIERQRHRMDLTLTLDEAGDVVVEAVEHVPDSSGAGTRRYLEQVQDERSFIQDLEAGLAGTFSGVAVTAVTVEGEEDPDAPLVLRYQFTAQGLARPEGEGLRIDTRIYDRYLRTQLGSQATRIYPLSIGYPFSEELRLTFRLPEGYRFRDVPAPVSLTTDLLDYSWTVEAGGAGESEVTVVRRTDLRVGRVTPEEYPSLFDALVQIDRAEALHMGASRSE